MLLDLDVKGFQIQTRRLKQKEDIDQQRTEKLFKVSEQEKARSFTMPSLDGWDFEELKQLFTSKCYEENFSDKKIDHLIYLYNKKMKPG